MSLRVVWWEPNLEPLAPVEPARPSNALDQGVRQQLRLYHPCDRVEVSIAEEECPSYTEAPNLQRRQAATPPPPGGFHVPLLSRLIAAAQWLAYQGSSH